MRMTLRESSRRAISSTETRRDMRIVTPEVTQISLSTGMALEFCSSVLRKGKKLDLSNPEFEESGLSRSGELTTIGTDFAHAVSNASTYFHCSSLHPGVGYELHIWASREETLCLRIRGSHATLWMIDACEILPVFAETAGFAPRQRKGASMPLLCRREVWELLAKGQYDDAEKLISLVVPPIEASFATVDQVPTRTETPIADTPTSNSDAHEPTQIPRWSAVVLERTYTREDDPTQLHISTLERAGFISTPTQLYSVKGIETDAEFNDIVTLLPTTPYAEWGLLTRISEVSR